MGANTPLGRLGSHPVHEEGNVVKGRPRTRGISPGVTLKARGWVEVRSQINWAFWRRVFISGKVKHVHYFGAYEAHRLKQNISEALVRTEGRKEGKKGRRKGGRREGRKNFYSEFQFPLSE